MLNGVVLNLSSKRTFFYGNLLIQVSLDLNNYERVSQTELYKCHAKIFLLSFDVLGSDLCNTLKNYD